MSIPLHSLWDSLSGWTLAVDWPDSAAKARFIKPHWAFAEPDPDDDKVKQASYETSLVYGHGHQLYYDDVIRARRGESRAETDGREGLRSLELLSGIYLSARDGKTVGLPLEL